MTMTEHWSAVRQRLAQFGEWVGRKAPEPIVDEDGAFTSEFLKYADQEELCLDWVYTGEVKPLAMAYRKDHQKLAWHAVFERVQMLSEVAGIEPVQLETEDGGVVLTDELTTFCEDAGGDLMWLLFGDVREMVQSHRTLTKRQEPMKRATQHLSSGEQKALGFTLKLILQGADVDEAMQTYVRAVEEERAA